MEYILPGYSFPFITSEDYTKKSSSFPDEQKFNVSNFPFVNYMVLSVAMKFFLFAVFVLFFVAVPFYLLNALVMPALTSMKQTYSHAGAIAQQVANQKY